MAGKQYKPKLIGDYEWDEVSSAINKMIRRNREYEACYWGYIIHQSGYGLYLWRRLALICAEDIGNSSPMTQILIVQQYEQLGKRLEIEEVCLDSHTQRGRKVWGRFGDNDGREEERLKQWRAEWNVVVPEAYKGKYLEELKSVEKEIIKRKAEKKE